jgi:hypothetical protein
VVGVRPEQAEVVVRPVVGVVRLEALEQRQHLVGARADQLAQQRLDLRLVLGAQLGLAGRDPQRGRAAVLGHPRPPVRERAVHEQAPPGPVLLHPPVRIRERPAPRRVVEEREREQRDDLVRIRLGH